MNRIIGAMNTQICTVTGRTPYELVFGQTPRSHYALIKELYDRGIRDEEDIPDNVEIQDSEYRGKEQILVSQSMLELTITYMN